jgi:hypothetical protein
VGSTGKILEADPREAGRSQAAVWNVTSCAGAVLNNQLESLLEETHIKLSSLVSDLLGVSARRMLKALADGETNPAAVAALAHQRLRATPEQLCDALGACTDLKPV